ncbi:MAG: LytTR family transcriptional regulator [Cyclobacteriaceae bacterium]|nr:LytTR family transcriptional regulator [Cyclobacteriaceae bacterium]
MNLLDHLRKPFPYYLNDDKKNIALITALSLFVIFFMTVYRPDREFNEHLNFPVVCLFGGITFVILSISIIVLPKIFTDSFDPVKWTLFKYILQTIGQCFVIGVVSSYIDLVFICPDKTFWEVVVHAFTQVALIGIIPVTIITLLLKNNMLQQNLRSAIKANQELEKITVLKNETPRHHPKSSGFLTLYSDTSETLGLNLPDLLFVEADDNYSTIFWKNENGVQKKLLRANLKNIESQIDNAFAIRCHRSYLVNINAISNITGNTNGYKLQINGTEYAIPVSRPKGKEVIEKIQQLRNVMELY